jgi:DNA-binding MarR family transcriptional regulator
MGKSDNLTPYSDLFRVIAMKIKHEADLKLNEIGLNSQQGHMIGYIYENQDKGVIQKDLAERFNRKGASISSMLQGLEKKGFIERIRPEDNERQKNIYVLEKGANLVDEFNETFLNIEDKIIKSLTNEEVDLLNKLLVKVKNNL